jgi:hypothetical protein
MPRTVLKRRMRMNAAIATYDQGRLAMTEDTGKPAKRESQSPIRVPVTFEHTPTPTKVTIYFGDPTSTGDGKILKERHLDIPGLDHLALLLSMQKLQQSPPGSTSAP